MAHFQPLLYTTHVATEFKAIPPNQPRRPLARLAGASSMYPSPYWDSWTGSPWATAPMTSATVDRRSRIKLPTGRRVRELEPFRPPVGEASWEQVPLQIQMGPAFQLCCCCFKWIPFETNHALESRCFQRIPFEAPRRPAQDSQDRRPCARFCSAICLQYRPP